MRYHLENSNFIMIFFYYSNTTDAQCLQRSLFCETEIFFLPFNSEHKIYTVSKIIEMDFSFLHFIHFEFCPDCSFENSSFLFFAIPFFLYLY